jgi:anti-sigma factor RsiW
MNEHPCEPRPVQEAELHAYVDGRLDPARAAEVECRMAADAALRQRVEAWRDQRDGLRAALDFKRREPVPHALSLGSLAEARSRAAARWRMAAGIVLALSLGGAGGWFARGQQRPTEIARLGMEAASAYRIFANDPTRAIEIGSENQAELVGWMTQKLGRRIAVPDLAPQGYHLLGGRVLAAMYGPAALLIYENAARDRITVYVQPMRLGEEAAMRPIGVQAVDGYAWINRQIGYSVMSDGDPGRLQSIADRVRDSGRS